MKRFHTLTLMFTLTSLVTACPDGEAQDAGPTDAGLEDGGIQEDGGPRVIECESGTALAEIKGRVVDEAGMPLEGAFGQACLRLAPSLTLLCLIPEATDANGDFSIITPEEAECVDQVVTRTFHPVQSLSTEYCIQELPSAVGPGGAVIGDGSEITLYGVTEAMVLPAEEPAADIRTVSFSDGLDISFVPDRYFGDYSRLAASRLDPAVDSFCLEGEEPFDGLFAMFPEAKIAGAFDMRIANVHGLPAAATVELFVLGGLSCELEDEETPVEEGHWESFGTGTVSADGTVIEALGSDGLPCWNAMAYRINQ